MGKISGWKASTHLSHWGRNEVHVHVFNSVMNREAHYGPSYVTHSSYKEALPVLKFLGGRAGQSQANQSPLHAHWVPEPQTSMASLQRQVISKGPRAQSLLSRSPLLSP